MTIRPRLAIAMLGAIALSALASPEASARSVWQGQQGGAIYAPEGVQPGLRTTDGRACVKQCPNDMLPCDPPYFKQADGRCTTEWH